MNLKSNSVYTGEIGQFKEFLAGLYPDLSVKNR